MEGDKLNYVCFYGDDGKIVATYDSHSGWSCIGTEEETVKRKELCSIYNEAWRNATEEIKSQGNAKTPKYLEGGTTFDAYA
jgi:hypothetical protein